MENSCCKGTAVPYNDGMSNQITKTSEYVKVGFKAGFLLESPVKETEKAIAFPCVKFTSCGNEYQGIAWLPKSQLKMLENDFYTNNAPSHMWLCPEWLYRKNFSYGETL